MTASQGRIVHIQHFSLHDGPGIRTTLFFKGCPLRCQWCANPEMQAQGIELVHAPTRCLTCGECVQACPDKLITLSDNSLTINRAACTCCGDCVNVCPAAALRLAGRDIALAQLLETIDGERHFYRHSGGGVTLSGGEPLAQPEFAEALLAACRRWSIHTALETCGAVPFETFAQIADQVDTLFFDLKLMDATAHEKYTQSGNRQILDNLAGISQRHPDLVIRFPLIPGINTGEAEMRALGKFLVAETAATRLELLNYHNLGAHKYAGLGRDYALANITPLDRQAFIELCTAFAAWFPTLQISYHT